MKLCVLTRWDFNFCVRSSLLWGVEERGYAKEVGIERQDAVRWVYVFDDLTTLRAKMLHYLKKTVPMLRNAWTVDRKIHCTKKRPPGLLERDCPRKIYTIDTPDNLSSLG